MKNRGSSTKITVRRNITDALDSRNERNIRQCETLAKSSQNQKPQQFIFKRERDWKEVLLGTRRQGYLEEMKMVESSQVWC